MLRKMSRESEAGMRHLKAKLALLTVLVCLAFASAAYALKPLIFRVEKTIEIAKEYGITLTAEDFKPEVGENISLDELNKVSGGADLPLCVGASGGKTCMCVIIGAATGCGCVMIGTN